MREIQMKSQEWLQTNMNSFQSLKCYITGCKILSLLAIFFYLSACATDLRQQVDHNIVIKNSGENRISDIYIDYGYPFRIEKKMIPPNSQTTDSGEYPIPVKLRAAWTTFEGKRVEIEIELKKNLEYGTKLRAVELWISDDKLEVYQATPRGARDEFTDRKRIYPR